MNKHQVSCSAILAASMGELFPAAQVLAFQATEKCFFCDVAFPFTFEKEMLPLLEDRMRSWVKKDLPFKELEMMPANAAQFLEHQGFPSPSIALEKGTVHILQMGHFVGRSPGKPFNSTKGVQFFKLVAFQVHAKWIRIIGTAAPTKDELKPQVEACKELPDHLQLMEELNLLAPCEGGFVWLPRGEVLKKILIEKSCQITGIDLISTPALQEKEMVRFHAPYPRSGEFIKLTLAGEGRELFNPLVGTVDRFFLPAQEESIISFLQIITKFLKIFPFEHEEVPLKKRPIEFVLSDALGRKWTGPRISMVGEKAGLSLFHSLERFTALLLEKYNGSLPFWLQPEQVRILSMHQKTAEEMKRQLHDEGFRAGIDHDDVAMTARLRRSLHERVPFSIVVGDREKTGGQLSVRLPGSPDALTMDLTTLMDRLRQLEN